LSGFDDKNWFQAELLPQYKGKMEEQKMLTFGVRALENSRVFSGFPDKQGVTTVRTEIYGIKAFT